MCLSECLSFLEQLAGQLMKHVSDMLLCRLNKCGVISPRYDLRHGDIETWIAKLLPSRLVSCLQDSVAVTR
jgi:hypothetical protein